MDENCYIEDKDGISSPEPIQVTDAQKRMEDRQDSPGKIKSSTSSTMNVYLRHNVSRGASQKLEPVKLNTTTGLQQIIANQSKPQSQASKKVVAGADLTIMNSGTPVAQASSSDIKQFALQRGSDCREQSADRISMVLNQQEFQHLGSTGQPQPLLQAEDTTEQSLEDYQQIAQQNMMRTGSPKKVLQGSIKSGSNEEVSLLKSGVNQAVGSPQGKMSQQSNYVDNHTQIQHQQSKITADADPSVGAIENQINVAKTLLLPPQVPSPPVGLLLQSNDQQLIELYQMQTQELMRIASEGLASPPSMLAAQQALAKQKYGSGVDSSPDPMATMEQAQQILMPELRYGEDYDDNLNSSSKNKSSKMGAGHNQQILRLMQPKLTNQSKQNLRPSNQTIGRFVDDSTLSQQTISVPDIASTDEVRHQVNASTSQTDMGSLQKFTLPAFSMAPVGKQSQTGSDEEPHTGRFKDKQMRNAGVFNNMIGASATGNGSIVPLNPRTDQLVIGLAVDSDDMSGAESPSYMLQSPTILATGQQVQWVRVPKPMQPTLVERTAVGAAPGATGPRATLRGEQSNYEKNRNDKNQPTFPAFFNKTTKNQQIKTISKELLKSDRTDVYKKGSLSQMNRLESLQGQKLGNEGTLTSRNLQVNNMLMGNRNTSKRASIGVTPSSPFNQIGSDDAMTVKGVSAKNNQEENKNKPSRKQYRPIRVQSVLAPYAEEYQDEMVSQGDKHQRESVSLMENSQQRNGASGNYIVSLLNKTPDGLSKQNYSNNKIKQKLKAASEQMQTVSMAAAVFSNSAAVYGAVINQDTKMSFKDYIELQQQQQSIEEKYRHEVARQYNRSPSDGGRSDETGQTGKFRRKKAESKDPSRNPTAVPRLGAMKPKRLLEKGQTLIGVITNVNGTSTDNGGQSINRLRRMTMAEAQEQQQARFSTLLTKNGTLPLEHSSNQGSTLKQLGKPKLSSLQKRSIQQLDLRNKKDKEFSSTFTGRTPEVPYGPDSTVEVQVVKESAQQHLTVTQGNAAVQASHNDTESQQTMHFGGKFQVNIHKRTSTQTLDESQAGQTSNSKEKDLHRMKSQISNQTNAVTSVITPKYFATIQAVPENANTSTKFKKKSKRKQLMQPQAHYKYIHNGFPQNGSYIDTALQRSFNDDADMDSPESPGKTTLQLHNYKNNSSETFNNIMLQNQQSPYSIMSSTKEQQRLHQAATPGGDRMYIGGGGVPVANQDYSRNQHFSNTQYSNIKFRNMDLNSPQRRNNHHADISASSIVASSGASPWSMRRKKLGDQPSLMTAERIVEKNIRPYDNNHIRKQQKILHDYEQQKQLFLQQEQQSLSSVQQANAQGIVMGNQMKISEGPSQIKLEVKSTKNFLPELNMRRQSNNMDEMAFESEIRQKSADPSGGMKQGAGVADQTVEIDSILSPDYLKLVVNSSVDEADVTRQNHDGEVSSIPLAEDSPRQERRQVIKILDQSKWRANKEIGIVIDNQNSYENHQLLPVANSGTKPVISSTADQKKRKTAMKPQQRQDLMTVLQEGSLHMDSVFDRDLEDKSNSIGLIEDSKRSIKSKKGGPSSSAKRKNGKNKSQMSYNKDLRMEGLQSSLLVSQMNPGEEKNDFDQASRSIEESEREMKEYIAHQGLMQEDLQSLPENSANDNAYNSVHIQAVFGKEDTSVPTNLKSTQYSQFKKHTNSQTGGTKQDFGQQMQAVEYDHLYQTINNMASDDVIPRAERSNHYAKIPAVVTKVNLITPNMRDQANKIKVRKAAKQIQMEKAAAMSARKDLNMVDSKYPVSVHTRKSLAVPIEKLKTQMIAAKQIQMQRQHFNKTFVGNHFMSQHGTMQQLSQRNNSISNTRVMPERPMLKKLNQDSHTIVASNSKKMQSMMSLTTTRFSQHHRALSELRSIQRQMHMDASEQSPPRGGQTSIAAGTATLPINKMLQVQQQLAREKPISPRKLKQLADREARLEQLRLKQETIDKQNALAREQSKKQMTFDRELEYLKDQNASARALSTHLGQHTALETYTQASVVGAPAPASQVIVNTSGSNTAYMPSPQVMNSPPSATPTVRQLIAGPPYALQQEKKFGPVLIEQSVLPQGRIYHYKKQVGGAQDGNNSDLIEADGTHGGLDNDRAGSSIIANYQKVSLNDEDQASPKSYKMPANFPHGADSQIDSIQGAPDSAGGQFVNESQIIPRLPVQSFTTTGQNFQQKTQSSKVNHRRLIMADQMKTDNNNAKEQFTNGDSVIGKEDLIRTLRIQKVPTKQDVSTGGVLPHNEQYMGEPQSYQDSINPMPERYEIENDSTQNISQVQDLLDVVQKEQERNRMAGIETMQNSHNGIDYELIQANIAAANNSSDRATPDQKKKDERTKIDKSMLLSSAQTLEADQNSPNHKKEL